MKYLLLISKNKIYDYALVFKAKDDNSATDIAHEEYLKWKDGTSYRVYKLHRGLFKSEKPEIITTFVEGFSIRSSDFAITTEIKRKAQELKV